jgi:NUMOD4 motif/HNH endonuclease
MSEEWRDVKGYEGRYQVSNQGRVLNLQTGNILKPWANKYGYRQITIWKDGKPQSLYVADWVAQEWLDPQPEGKELNHKNHDRNDNSAANLEWVTHQENITHNRLSGRKIARQKLTEDDVRRVRFANEQGLTQSHIAKWFGVHQCTISDILTGRTWKHLQGGLKP